MVKLIPDVERNALLEKLNVPRAQLVRAIELVKSENKVLAKSRKGALGQIVVKRQGVQPDKCARIVKQFEDNVGGKLDVADKLMAVQDKLTDREKLLIEFITDPKRKRTRLAHHIAEAQVDPAAIIKKYSEGALVLGQAEALAEAARALGPIARDLVRQATVEKVACVLCLGRGKVPASRFVGDLEEVLCTACKGKGGEEKTGKNYQFAVQKLLDMTKMGKPENEVNVNVGVQTNISSNFMERLAKMTEVPTSISIEAEAEILDADTPPDEFSTEDPT